jgi:hypothetical protein
MKLLDLVNIVCGIFFGMIGRMWPFLGIAFGFAAFVYLNEGIVVGDRSHHEAHLHFPQIFYFVTFSAAWLWPEISLLILHKGPRSFFLCRNFVISALAFIPIALYLVHHYTFAHAYLLADNRHYTFYIWKKFFKQTENAKYFYTIIYFVAAYSLWELLGSSKRTFLWRIFFFLSVCAALVPSSLLEFRYFIIPYFFIFLHSRPSAMLEIQPIHENHKKNNKKSGKDTTVDTLRGNILSKRSKQKKTDSNKIGDKRDGKREPQQIDTNINTQWIFVLLIGLIELTQNLVINLFTFYLFLYYPFTWPDSSTARWMW